MNYYQEDHIHNDNSIEVEDILLGSSTLPSSSASLQHYTNEYDRDNEFYRRRNEEYYQQQQQQEQKENNQVVLSTATLAATIPTTVIVGELQQLTDLQQQTQYHQQQYQKEQNNKKDSGEYMLMESINTSLKASHSSFKHIENLTYGLLTEKPLLALGIFFAAGLVVAYMIGFLFLDGYIESINPISNDMIPYWEDAEIHTIDAYIR